MFVSKLMPGIAASMFLCGPAMAATVWKCSAPEEEFRPPFENLEYIEDGAHFVSPPLTDLSRERRVYDLVENTQISLVAVFHNSRPDQPDRPGSGYSEYSVFALDKRTGSFSLIYGVTLWERTDTRVGKCARA